MLSNERLPLRPTKGRLNKIRTCRRQDAMEGVEGHKPLIAHPLLHQNGFELKT